ncbi:MAG TPA: aminotransferase class V-fold PLP-dependent enzyme [Microbacterium sp.]|uniref:aminotransferase class I/II-fold pyridoxal phosphate-dependent enzyme n=1 Tax=Microbacterium sp. TaxID=51671 RepID=UPI002B477FAA|nr:aminotransferase class V-fold PLP-dependent enzyme [Microbacterium sp.]HKT58013.1 aminotransferase class V-fold PLP-dependent enzyme [Microbacterium sp.]
MTIDLCAAPLLDRLAGATPSPTPYADALAAHGEREQVRLIVPGHAADPLAAPRLTSFFGESVLQRDVTPLIPGLDLGPHNALQQARDLAAEAWSARRTWFLTNGASQANRTIALALASYQRTDAPVVVQRSAHSSTVDGIVVAGLRPVFVQPSIDTDHGIAHGVSAAALTAALADAPGCKAVVLTSPSYFGAVADIPALAEIAHTAGAALIVDGAWASHFGFHEDLPAQPLTQGADVLVSSTHKFGGSLTQSAMLHLADTVHGRALEPLIERAFGLTQSTSESSLLLASLDLARAELVDGHDGMTAAIAAAAEIRDRIRRIGRFGIASDDFTAFDDIVAVDPMRVSIDVSRGGVGGHTARNTLMQRGVFLEIATETCVVAILGPGVVPDIDRFIDELHALPASQDGRIPRVGTVPTPGELVMLPRDAFLRPSVAVAAQDAVGRVSAETLAAYPPGIPNVMPGEVITAEAVRFLTAVSNSPGGHVRGASDRSLGTLRVIDDAPAG